MTNPPANMCKTLNGHRYNTATARLIASDDGLEYHVYQTPTGNFFQVRHYRFPEARDEITALTNIEAMGLYDMAEKQYETFRDTFTFEKLEDAK